MTWFPVVLTNLYRHVSCVDHTGTGWISIIKWGIMYLQHVGRKGHKVIALAMSWVKQHSVKEILRNTKLYALSRGMNQRHATFRKKKESVIKIISMIKKEIGLCIK